MGQIYIPGTADPGEVLAGQTFSAGTNYQATGIMPNRGAPTITPGTANIGLNDGYYSGGTVLGDPDLIAANIKNGVSIFGVSGTVGRFASGSGTTNTANGKRIIVSGLSFTPSAVIIVSPYTGTDSGAVWCAPDDFSICMNSTSNTYGTVIKTPLDGSTYYVTNGGFAILTFLYTTYNWYAWEIV